MKKHYKENIYEAAEPVPNRTPQNCYLRAEVVSILEDNITLEGYTASCYLGNY